MSAAHGEATGLDGVDEAGGAESTVTTGHDIAAMLKARRSAAARMTPMDDGARDPLGNYHLPEPTRPCSRGFACLAQPIDVLARAHHCPCDEAREAVA